METSSLGQDERTRIADNARQKLLANQAVNHKDAIVNVETREPTEDGQAIFINVWLPSDPSNP